MAGFSVERIVFLSLVLDLFAFTIPLPLFPRIIEWYTKRESGDPTGFLSRTLTVVSTIRGFFYTPGGNPKKWDVVLLGGLMGSVFSALQWFISPHIGSLSDKYGRKRILLITMIGNILSALVWIQSTSFASYLLSRVIGGLSEGNVQLAIAILSDITTPANRSKALAHVGIAFAICFCIGPPIGAYFASQPLPTTLAPTALNVYATPALITLVLLLLETVFLIVALPETRGRRAVAPAPTNGHANGNGVHKAESEKDEKKTNGNGVAHENVDGKAAATASVGERLALLGALRQLHFLFLGVFSGVEFTLTFLTFDLFDWTNTQNGTLIGSIGILSALLQGGYVRRALPRTGAGAMARRGVSACALGLVLLALVPLAKGAAAVGLLRAAAACMAFTSATVVNALTAQASLQCDEGVDEKGKVRAEAHAELAKGKALGKFRSAGQLGRAIGPLLACASYWTVGPALTYAVSAVAMGVLASNMKKIVVKK